MARDRASPGGFGVGTSDVVIGARIPAARPARRASRIGWGHARRKVPAGAGPRHLAFHPNGKFVYVVNELGNTVTAFNWKDGKLAQLQDIGTLPKDFTSESYTAEIRVHPSGRFLYVSNRGHNSITLFEVRDSGQLTFITTFPTGGDWPRNFEIDPTGKWLIVANERSNHLQVFRIDQATGILKQTDSRLQNIPAPLCVRFLTMP